jgi:hypothetical protein
MFKLTIRTGNAAFSDGLGYAEVSRILAEVAVKVGNGITEGRVSDSNGNRVGDFRLTFGGTK